MNTRTVRKYLARLAPGPLDLQAEQAVEDFLDCTTRRRRKRDREEDSDDP